MGRQLWINFTQKYTKNGLSSYYVVQLTYSAKTSRAEAVAAALDIVIQRSVTSTHVRNSGDVLIIEIAYHKAPQEW